MIWMGAARGVIVDLKSEKSEWLDIQPNFGHLFGELLG